MLRDDVNEMVRGEESLQFLWGLPLSQGLGADGREAPCGREGCGGIVGFCFFFVFFFLVFMLILMVLIQAVAVRAAPCGLMAVQSPYC